MVKANLTYSSYLHVNTNISVVSGHNPITHNYIFDGEGFQAERLSFFIIGVISYFAVLTTFGEEIWGQDGRV